MPIKKHAPLLLCLLVLGIAMLVFHQRFGREATQNGFYVPIGSDGRARIDFAMATDFQEIPLGERVYPAPAGLVDFLKVAGMATGRQTSMVPVSLGPQPHLLRNILASLAPNLKRKLSRDLLGVYLVAGMGADAFASYGFASLSDDKPVAAFIVLDLGSFFQDGLEMKANAWMSRHVSGAFEPDPSFSLEAKIADKAEDRIDAALSFALLHELGYVIAMNASVYPTTEMWRWTPETTTGFGFFDLSWRASGQIFESLWDGEFPDRARLNATDGNQLKASEMAKVYGELEKTDLPSLTGARSPFEDFAESFATYAHTEIFRKPYQIRVFSKGKAVKTIGSCWREKRCEKKRAALERLLKSI